MSTVRPSISGLGYPLTPMQQGMLYQASLEAAGKRTGHNVEQLVIKLPEALDPRALSEAFGHLLRQHSVLSNCFSWEHEGEPLQRAVEGLTVPIAIEDWRSLSDERRAARMSEFLERDRRLGFDLRVAPLMRASLLFTSTDRAELVWTFHHILLDGRSFAVVLRDLFRAYRAVVAQRPVALGENTSFSDYVLAARRTYDPSTGRSFFREALRDLPGPTPLPSADLSGDTLCGSQQRELSWLADAELARGLELLAQATGTSLGTVVHAAWALVLARHAGEPDVLFGTVSSGRTSSPAGDTQSPVAGMLVNTLPLRVRIDESAPIADFLATLHAQRRALRAHHQLSLPDIQLESGLPGGRPLFESIVNFDTRELNDTLRESDPEEWQHKECTLHERPTPPLSVNVVAGNAQLRVQLLFDPTRFTPAAQARVLTSLSEILAQLSRAPADLRSVDALTAAEKRRLLVDFNQTARDAPELLIQQLFEARADQLPTAPALELAGRALSYGELERQANKLAHTLRAEGAGPGQYVGVSLDRSFSLVIALLAVVKSGAAYLPLDPHLPTDRLELVRESAGSTLVITEKKYGARFNCARLVLDDAAQLRALELAPSARLAPSGTPGDVCYVMFTSGSTGRPKGVVLSHRAVVNTLDWVNRSFSVTSADRLLFVTPASFDLSVYDIFGLLGAGGTLVIASDAELADPVALAALIGEKRITIWNSAPAALQRLAPLFGSAPRTDAGTERQLRLVLLSGDWIPLSLPDAVRSAFPWAQVVSLGGATEAAIWSNWFPVGAVDPSWSSIPYGKPIQNARYYVLDALLRPVPVGTRGDLYIAGACLAEGYLGQPELTASRFLTVTLDGIGSERLYKTGDLARHRPDGNLELLGRSDFQVKIRGFRVELGEIEAALSGQPGVRQALCLTREDASRHKALIAYVAGSPAQLPNEAALKQALARKLPEYMVPSRIVALETFPLTPTGKVDRAALPEPRGRPEGAPRAVPESTLERQLVAIWEELLQLKGIGTSDDFFAVGGHSLLVLTLLSALKLRLNLDVSLPRFLERPSIDGIVSQLGSAHGGLEGQGLPAGSTGTALALLGSGLHLLLYRELARLLASQLPVRQCAAGLKGGNSDRSPGALAERELLGLDPRAPLMLGGFRQHAREALSLARNLEAQGRQVGLVVLFDPEEAPRARRPSLRALLTLPGQSRAPWAELRCPLLVVYSHGLRSGQTIDLHRQVRGAITTLHVPGEHMAFLGSAQERARVLRAIKRLLAVAGLGEANLLT